MNLIIPRKGDEFTLEQDWEFHLSATHVGLGIISACALPVIVDSTIQQNAPNVRIPKLTTLRVTKVRSYRTGTIVEVQLCIIFCVNKKLQGKSFIVKDKKLDNILISNYTRAI